MIPLFHAEKGEVHSDHYKLLPVDLRNIDNLNDIIARANLDPRFVIASLLFFRNNFFINLHK